MEIAIVKKLLVIESYMYHAMVAMVTDDWPLPKLNTTLQVPNYW